MTVHCLFVHSCSMSACVFKPVTLPCMEARSFRKIQADALAAIADGAQSVGLQALASAGAKGKHPQNASRDCLRKVKKEMALDVEPYCVEVVVRKRKTTECKIVNAAVLLPHEMFAALSKIPAMFDQVFGCAEDWVRFWQHSSQEVWFLDHPLRDFISTFPHLAVPLSNIY